MGAGVELEKILKDKNVSVKELSRQCGIAATTLYSIIHRDTAIRYDFALKISNVLNVPVKALCEDIPIETSPSIFSDDEIRLNSNKSSFFSNQTLKLINGFNSYEYKMMDELISDFYVLDDDDRDEIIQIIKMKHNKKEKKRLLNI